MLVFLGLPACRTYKFHYQSNAKYLDITKRLTLHRDHVKIMEFQWCIGTVQVYRFGAGDGIYHSIQVGALLVDVEFLNKMCKAYRLSESKEPGS